MEKKQRVAILGVGDGGGNQLLAQCVYLQAHSPDTLDKVIAVPCNTNRRSLQAHSRELRGMVTVAPLEIGPKTTRLQGSGSLWKVGRKAMEESITNDVFCDFFKEHRVDAVICNASFGDGGTGMGGLFPLVRHLRDDLRLLIIPSVCYGSIEKSTISPTRQRELADRLAEFDEHGIPLVMSLMDTIDDSYSREQAHGFMDQVVARAIGGMVEVLADPRRFDHNDFLVRLYANPNGGRKRLRMNGLELPLKFAEDPAALADSVRSLFTNKYYDFDDTNIGGVLLVAEHGGLSMSQETSVSRILASLIQEKFEAKEGNRGKPGPAHLKPVFVTGEKGSSLKLSLVLSEYTGWVDSPADIPAIRWMDDEDFEGGEVEELIPHQPREEGCITIQTSLKADQATALLAEAKSDPENTMALAVATKEEASEQKLEPPKPIYSSFASLATAAKEGNKDAMAVLQADLYRESLPDGRKLDDVVTFSREGELWQAQVLKSLHTLVSVDQRLRNLEHDPKKKDKLPAMAFSESWGDAIKDALRICCKGLPRKEGREIIPYSLTVSALAALPSLRDLGKDRDRQELVLNGCRAQKLFGDEFLEELLTPAEVSNGVSSLFKGAFAKG